MMVRLGLESLITHLFLLIHSSTTDATTHISQKIQTIDSMRPCNAYDRCSRQDRKNASASTPEIKATMSYGQNLISDGGNCAVGFFVREKNIYLGTWYTSSSSPERVLVWVANRDNPIPSRLGRNCSLVLGEDGIAKVLDSNHHPYWSTQFKRTSDPSQFYLRILNNGNLVLEDKYMAGGILWQSFDEPTDTFLPGMDIVQLTSWKTAEDPAQGNYLLQRIASDELLMYDLSESSTTPYWRSSVSSLGPDLMALLSNNMTEESAALRLVMNSTGRVQLWKIDKEAMENSLVWEAPKDECDFSSTCGSYGVCDPGNGFKCKCLPGYYPNDTLKWESGDFSGGCSRRSTGGCGQVLASLPMIKPPPQPSSTTTSSDDTECKNQCLSDCGCKAYAIDANRSRCLTWADELSDIQEEYYRFDAITLHIRLHLSDIESGSRTCNICGTNVIPYPLSTNPTCGDQTYSNFECNRTNGQLYFKPSPNGMPYYKVSVINPEHTKFTVQLVAASMCDSTNNIQSKEFNLNTTSPFRVTNCSIVPLMERPPVVEVEVAWNPPSQPACNSPADCKDWPQTKCDWDKVSKKVCLCANGTQWDSLSTNCTKVVHGDQKHMSLLLKVGTACGSVLILLSAISFVIYLRKMHVTHKTDIVHHFKTDDIDIPFVDYQSIVAATDNFSDANKLGAGGFGPVYKGKLADGCEVAIKRLSAASAQGVLEFRNEILLIAKLQHRNLVRVVGYCIQEDEKILIYEYMPNKSLDSFLFNRSMKTLLAWPKRFDIIMGIARGLLYLHQDSRLRIIHRDLKPGNILLDEDLNPKISDFGLAKILAGKDMATNTARVVGTYGYMSPEYALEGYFSLKSDVYSFGIIVLEIISGRRCTTLLQGDSSLINLLGYAWALWKQGKQLELVDDAMIDACNSIEIRRCITVALLSVQENPGDRPTMSTVLFMLADDSMNLPHPKQPVFVARRQHSTPTSSSKLGSASNVELTTTVEGR